MLIIVIYTGIIVSIDGFDSTRQKCKKRVILFFGHMVCYTLSSAINHTDSIS